MKTNSSKLSLTDLALFYAIENQPAVTKKVLPTLQELRSRPRIVRIKGKEYTFSTEVDFATAKELIERDNGSLVEGERLLGMNDKRKIKHIRWKVFRTLSSNYTGD